MYRLHGHTYILIHGYYLKRLLLKTTNYAVADSTVYTCANAGFVLPNLYDQTYCNEHLQLKCMRKNTYTNAFL